MDLLLFHLIFLVWLTLAAVVRWLPSLLDRVLAAGLLGWANLIATELILSAWGRLGEPICFLGTSLGLAALTVPASRVFPAAAVDGDQDEITPPPSHPILLIAALGSLGVLAWAGIVAALHYPPLDPAAVSYTLPRSLIQVGEGTLFSQPTSDARQVLLPFNHGLIQTALLVYQPPLSSVALANSLAWLLAGCGIYRLSRLWHAGPNAALLATWCALTATPVLAQAVTTAPVLPATAALLAAACFGLAWVRQPRPGLAALAGLGAGLAAGSHVGVFLLVALALPIGFATRRLPRHGSAWAAWAGLALGLLPLGLTLAHPGGRNLGDQVSALWQTATGPGTLGTGVLWPLWHEPDVLRLPNENNVSLGLTGLLCLLAPFVGLWHFRRQRRALLGLVAPAFVWLAGLVLAGRWVGFDSADLVPAVLLAAPALALLWPGFFRGCRPLLPAGVALLLGLGALWSAYWYLQHNAWRPLAPIVSPGLAAPRPPPLPASLALRLTQAHRVNFITTAAQEPLLLLMGHQQMQRYRRQDRLAPDGYNIVSHAAGARDAPLTTMPTTGAYVLVPFPDKPTAGFEPLGRCGEGRAARDYYGITGTANTEAPLDGNRYLLVSIRPVAAGDSGTVRIQLQGLNPRDAARLEISTQQPDGSRTPIGQLTDETPFTLLSATPYQYLIFQIVSTADGRDLGGATLSSLPPSSNPPPAGTPDDAHRRRAVELISTDHAPVIRSEGLAAPEGPFPDLQLPLIRWARSPHVRLLIPVEPGLDRLRLSLSFRLHTRTRGLLEIICNGAQLQRIEVNDALAWQELTLDLPFRPGENIVELRDIPLLTEPDWADYLRRYPDVKRYLESIGQDPEQGALAHYEYAGKAEGRILRQIQLRSTPPSFNYFMFRSLRVEEFVP